MDLGPIDTRFAGESSSSIVRLILPILFLDTTAPRFDGRSVGRFDVSTDAGNGKKGTKPSPQQDKAADVAGRKTAGVPGSGAEMAEGNQSPPKAEVDDSPLQHAMDRNKEWKNRMEITPGVAERRSRATGEPITSAND
ncbi:hypothetical protein WN48_02296 [Eufriesea mexicana]|nr:hypothetical protein WN48_02296 [Eufriesea mexicana]